MVSGPVFYFDKAVEVIGSQDDNGVSIPIPHGYFKSVLAENDKGALHMWSFLLDNEGTDRPIADFRVPTIEVERKAGIQLWPRLMGPEILREKKRVRRMW